MWLTELLATSCHWTVFRNVALAFDHHQLHLPSPVVDWSVPSPVDWWVPSPVDWAVSALSQLAGAAQSPLSSLLARNQYQVEFTFHKPFMAGTLCGGRHFNFGELSTSLSISGSSSQTFYLSTFALLSKYPLTFINVLGTLFLLSFLITYRGLLVDTSTLNKLDQCNLRAGG